MPSSGRGLCFPLVKACVFGNEPKASDEVPLAPRTEPAETTPTWQALKLLFCAVGLQVGRQALLLFLGQLQWAELWNQSFHPASPNSVLAGVLCVPPPPRGTLCHHLFRGGWRKCLFSPLFSYPLFCDLYTVLLFRMPPAVMCLIYCKPNGKSLGKPFSLPPLYMRERGAKRLTS